MKNVKKIFVLVFMILLLTGCGTKNYLINSKKEIISNPETGQSIQKNIFCQPTDKNLLKIYQENEKQLDYKLKDLPKCQNFKITCKQRKFIIQYICGRR